jgi:hypothetical protein
VARGSRKQRPKFAISITRGSSAGEHFRYVCEYFVVIWAAVRS